MSAIICLAKVIVDTAIFLEFTPDGQLNEDLAIEMMEQLSAELQGLSESERQNLATLFKNLSTQIDDVEKRAFVEELAESWGLI